MKIETKFDVNNLVSHKYQKRPTSLLKDKIDFLCCFEVIDVDTSTCMAGTQVFYTCRSIHGIKASSHDFDNKKEVKFIDFSPGQGQKGEYLRFREDELVEAPQDLIDLILDNK